MSTPLNLLTTTTKIYSNPVGSAALTALTLPTGVTISSTIRPSRVEYARQRYFVGPYSSNLTFIESNSTIVTTGITAPASAPVITAGAAGVPTGIAIGYLTFRHKIGSTIIHESNGSSGSTPLTVAAQKVEWASIPATSPDARATHVVLYRSMDGADPREVVELALGTTTYSDNIATAALGQVMPTLNGVPPLARFVAKYHDRAWYVSRADPSRTYYSELFKFEAVGTNSYIATRDGETVTGVARVLDQLAIFGRRCTYDIQGYTSSDFNMRKVHPSVGCISHFAIVNIDERLFFPAEDGVWIYDGAGFNYTMEDLRSYWFADYNANTGRYNDLTASADRSLHVYRLLLKRNTTPLSFYYIGHYLGMDGGKPIRWTFDVRAREDNAVGEMDLGDGLVKSFTGSCDGFVREENVDSDADDDGDTYAKKFLITLKADPFDDIGGGTTSGKVFTDINVYMQAESNAWTLNIYAGGESATDSLSPALSIPIAASASTQNGQTFVAEGEHFRRLSGVSGAAIAPQFSATSPLGMRLRGWDCYWREGPSYRRRQT